MEPAVRQLDLSKCGPGLVVDRVGVAPGLRSSTAFFTFLRANLVLTPSALSSNSSSPHAEPVSPQPWCPPSPSLAPILAPTGDIPPISLDALTTESDRDEGLSLVARSVAQMDLRAARALAFHPLSLALLVAVWAVVLRLAFTPGASPGRTVLLSAALAAAYLSVIRLYTRGYGPLARTIDRHWLQPDGDHVVVVGARRGHSLVGALVLRLECKGALVSSSLRRRNRNRSTSLRGGKGVIRAWTTRADHRGRGIGRDLLAAAVRITKDRCGKDAQLGFAKDHANSAVLLPGRFAAPFRRAEMQAARALEAAEEEWELSRKKKKVANF
ncbi:hypothetical protein XA68_17895 [Ophiocordyceps unilateralis]|uniref:N-acetyltransferase domain-containing protein n=1 Tax=Ophiocordyceps unilateralis TaxID=268505 RepID=A0A2A9P451_OPHUN|nr:hypothetical protein XA68_17895 [Ophiocordyceps unilateralis]